MNFRATDRVWLLAAVAVSALALGAADDSSGVSFDGKTYTNRLIHSNDPYLLLHAHNPVDWYPWGPEALEKARSENKPIFLSVGYSTCYWCHVAEREIYSNPDIARLMNQWFVNVKVDREERPDVDRVYMLATQIMTGAGGWPNNVFLTPDLKPFFAGSYFPPKDFARLLSTMHEAWGGKHSQLILASEEVSRAMQEIDRPANGTAKVSPSTWLDEVAQQAAARFDRRDGGFSGGGETKFPQAPLLGALLAAAEQRHDMHAQEMLATTLRAMAEGGVMDQLDGGFHRYSTEPSWSIPHFEKMLYDNAQLLGLYARAYALTKAPLFKQVALRTAHYLTQEMLAPDGGFYSAQDAEVDGVEGASYVWTREAIETTLGSAGATRFFALYALTPMPQIYAGQKQPAGSVLRLDRNKANALADKQALAASIESLAPLRASLLAARNRREQPARDEKVVTAGNALAIIGFAQAGQALDDSSLTKVAIESADWEWQHVFDPKTGDLRHQLFRGQAGDQGFLDDYALLGQAFLMLHTTTGEAVWGERARQLADALLQRFTQADGRLSMVAGESGLPVAPRQIEGDSVQPSGPSEAVALLLGVAADDGALRYAQAAQRALAALSPQVETEPTEWSALIASLSQPALMAALNRASVATAQAAPKLPDSAEHVHTQGRWEAAGEVVVTIEVDPGYHINANPASDQDLVPTTLSVEGADGATVEYPAGQKFKAPFASQDISVYTGHIELRERVPARSVAPRRAHLRVQVCNDRYCLAPATIDIAVSAPR